MAANADSGSVNEHGYKVLKLGSYSFSRDEYFAHIDWPGGSHLMPADRFLRAVTRKRVVAQRMAGLKDDTPLRNDQNGFPVNRQFADVAQDEPEVRAEPGFENEVHAFNFFAYLSRSDVTWNPSVCAVVKDAMLCPTTEEFALPVIHGNDRVEWFLQLSDEIHWEIADRPRARA